MSKEVLTIFTATYNRAYCLDVNYQALKRQTNKNFKWLIIDDGSTDLTETLVKKWQEAETDFIIEYIYKENGGLHTGYNKAIEIIDTELCVCIDSDDFMPDNGVDLIINHWELHGNSNYAGIIGLDFLLNGNSIGGDLPPVKSLFLLELVTKYKYKGDTKVVYRTELLKKVAPQPTFNNEKNFNPIYLMYLVDRELPLLVLNENLCFVDYQANGMSNAIFSQFSNSPNSFSALRKLYMTMPNAPFVYVFKQNMHYVSSNIFAKNIKFIKESPMKFLTITAIPFGILLHFYILFKLKKNNLS
ncbi:glycosyltransferase family A protein [Mucilaginibacter sp. UR6-11]|uniref:glycosyltransferase family 2 protein n=1 Tax=Mucilaginibacter sp. UR6-11 TaxID=1435644 RepID=UPI001E41F888|nr:glycosyltransferase family A protein [Mucilaginibacter sp. UR6-11]MCC8424863.1 glycosyltransferase family 2 protein [Mucilaginibacter sp. UR6-11]